jgi:hypothetical protein
VLFFKKVSANYQKKGYKNTLATHNAVKVNKKTFNPIYSIKFYMAEPLLFGAEANCLF